MLDMTKVDLRFITARGIEYREYHSRHWQPITPQMLAACTANELRIIADVMDAQTAPTTRRQQVPVALPLVEGKEE